MFQINLEKETFENRFKTSLLLALKKKLKKYLKYLAMHSTLAVYRPRFI
jgi:hypothetical protein